MNAHGVNDVVISCIDYRFRKRVGEWIDQNLEGKADLIAVAGASKALLEDASKDYVLHLIDIAVKLHGVTTIHIIDHIDCGAYGGSKEHNNPEAETTFHAGKCEAASEVILKAFPTMSVERHIMTFDGMVEC